MRTSLSAAVLVAAVLGITAPASEAAITYSINRSIGAGSVIGTLSTDGTVGGIASANIVGWSLTLNSNDGSGNLLITDGNSGIFLRGDGLTATEGGLFFNFGGTADFLLIQYPTIGSGHNFWCIENDEAGCNGFDPQETVYRNGGSAVSRAGNLQIGSVTSVPEPGTLAILGIGVAGLAVARRRKPQ